MLFRSTKNILFICGGAFDGIERKIAQRLNSHVVGYSNTARKGVDRDNFLQYVAPQDLKSFGLIPEIIGRLPILTHLEPLDRDALRRVLTEPKNAITRQYEKLFRMDGVELVFTPEALDLIVDKAIDEAFFAKKSQMILKAKSKSEIEKILKPSIPYYHAGRMVPKDSPYYVEEEELILWYRTSFRGPLNDAGYNRYLELFQKLLPEQAKALEKKAG